MSRKILCEDAFGEPIYQGDFVRPMEHVHDGGAFYRVGGVSRRYPHCLVLRYHKNPKVTYLYHVSGRIRFYRPDNQDELRALWGSLR